MKKLIIFIMLILLASFVYATDSKTAADYITADGLNESDAAIDGVTVVNGGDPYIHGWTQYTGAVQYSNMQAYFGTVSLRIPASTGLKDLNLPNNNSFDGIVKAAIHDDTDTGRGWWFYIWDGAGATNFRMGLHQGANEWWYDDVEGCDENTINRVAGWHNLSYEYTSASTVDGYIDGVLCHSWTGKTGLDETWLAEVSGGSGVTYVDSYKVCSTNPCTQEIPPVSDPTALFIEPPTPADNYKNNTLGQNITVECSENGYPTIYFEAANPPTNVVATTTTSNQTHWIINDSIVTADGDFFYYGNCSNSTSIATAVRVYHLHTVEPNITLSDGNAFDINNITANPYDEYILINLTVADAEDLDSFEFSIIQLNGTVRFNYINTSLTGNKFNFTTNIDVSAFPSEIYLVNISASDSHTAKKIKDYSNKKITNGIEFDTAEGNNLKIWSKDKSVFTAVKTLDRYSINVEFNSKGNKKRTFYIRGDKPLKPHETQWLAHFTIGEFHGANWIDFETSELVDPTYSIKKIDDYTYQIIFDKIKDKLTFNSIGGLNVNSVQYKYTKSNLGMLAVLLSPGVPSPDDQISGTCRAIEGLDNNIFYNWTLYKDDAFNVTGISPYFASNFTANVVNVTIANVVAGDNWTLGCIATSDTFIVSNSTQPSNSTEIEVIAIIINDCGVGSAVYPILNMSYYNQLSGDAITLTNGVDLTFFDGFNTLSTNKIYTGNTSDVLCTNVNPANRTYEWEMTGAFNLQKDGFASSLYDIPSAVPITISNNPIYDLDLFLIQLNQSSTILFIWLTNTYIPVDGTMHVYECKGDGTRTLQQSIPIIGGDADANLELLNTAYSYEVLYKGETFSDFSDYSKCHLESQTSRRFFIDLGIDVSPVVGMYSIDCNITKTGNNSFSMNWGTNPESTDTITGCVFATRFSATGNIQTYEDCSTTSPLVASIPVSGFEYHVSGKMFQDIYSIQCTDVLTFETSTDAADLFGLSGLFAIVLLIVGMILIYSNESPIYYPVIAGLSLVMAFILGVVAFGWVTITSLLFFIFIIILIGRAKKN